MQAQSQLGLRGPGTRPGARTPAASRGGCARRFPPGRQRRPAPSRRAHSPDPRRGGRPGGQRGPTATAGGGRGWAGAALPPAGPSPSTPAREARLRGFLR